jgi:hypothetical protein
MKESESEVLKIEETEPESESGLLCTDSTDLDSSRYAEYCANFVRFPS